MCVPAISISLPSIYSAETAISPFPSLTTETTVIKSSTVLVTESSGYRSVPFQPDPLAGFDSVSFSKPLFFWLPKLKSLPVFLRLCWTHLLRLLHRFPYLCQCPKCSFWSFVSRRLLPGLHFDFHDSRHICLCGPFLP